MAGRPGGALLLLLATIAILFWLLPGDSVVGLTTGFVRSADGPVAGAVVRFKGTALAVHTDADGYFRLPTHPTAARVTAWKAGYFIAGAPRDPRPLTLHLKPLPDEDFEDYAWVDPRPSALGVDNCANCHAGIFREWRHSAHSRSATNPRFLNLYAGTDWHGRANVGWNLLADNPDGAGVCTSCHAPTVRFGDPAYYDLRAVEGVAAHGVHCDYCHKITGPEPTSRLGTTHGRFGLKLLRPEPGHGQNFFGPLDDVDRGEDGYSRFYRSSRYCASCHEGVVFGVHVYSTYSEWLASPAGRQGRQCQDCHMTPTGQMTNVAPRRGGIERDPQTLGNHRMVAGSQEEMLRRCIQVAADVARGPDGVSVTVAVGADAVGHRLPTGFVDRHLVLVVGTPENAPATQLAGPVLPALAGPGFAGQPGHLFARVLQDARGLRPAPFWNARPEFTDTRLQPGRTEQFHFTLAPGTGPVRIRLLHRRFWPEVAAAKGWPADAITICDIVR